MKKTFKVKEKCQHCKGTGIYDGFAETDGCGVVCNKCKGTGCYQYEHTYEEFEEREVNSNIKHVLEVNPGISVGRGDGYLLKDFGGMTYEEWLDGKPFVKGMEMRKFSCPAWWYQIANYDLKPDWKECKLRGRFLSCSNFEQKHKCWERFDNERS